MVFFLQDYFYFHRTNFSLLAELGPEGVSCFPKTCSQISGRWNWWQSKKCQALYSSCETPPSRNPHPVHRAHGPLPIPWSALAISLSICNMVPQKPLLVFSLFILWGPSTHTFINFHEDVHELLLACLIVTVPDDPVRPTSYRLLPTPSHFSRVNDTFLSSHTFRHADYHSKQRPRILW